MSTDFEQRTIDVDVSDLDTRGRTVVGYASVYDIESSDLGGFREKVQRGAFTEVLPDSDVRCLLNHDPNQILGRTRSGTLRLSDDERGLRFECDLPSSPLGENVREAVKRGDVDGASFRFVVGADQWEGDLRTVTNVKELHDVTIATFAAYPAASVELRTRPERDQLESSTSAPCGCDDEARSNDTSTGSVGATSTNTSTTGGLSVESRTATSDNTIEHRVSDALRSIRKGESRSLTTTSAAAIAPAELNTYLWDRLRSTSVALRTGIKTVSTDRDQITWPTLTGDVTPGWTSEAAAITPSDPTFATLTATPRKLAALVQASNEVIDDSDPSILDVLNSHVATILGLKLDLAMFEGSGTAPEIRGLKNVSGITAQSMGTNGAAISTLDTVATAISTLESVNAKAGAIVMHPRTWQEVRTLKDSQNRYLVADSATVDAPTRLFGVPVYLTTQLSITETQGTSSAASSIYVFDPSQVVLVQRRDATIEVDRSRLFNSDQTEIRGKLRADLVVPNPTAIVRIKGVL